VFPPETYDVVTFSFYRAVDRLSDITESLATDGILFVQHHLRTDADIHGWSGSDRHQFAANELLHACLDLTVLYYTERTERRDDDRRSAVVEIVARNSSGHYQTYPEIESA